jgi:hypothetical protein
VDQAVTLPGGGQLSVGSGSRRHAAGQWITSSRWPRCAALAALFAALLSTGALAQPSQPSTAAGSRVVHDSEVAVKQAGGHGGGGMTTGYPFFEDV